MYEKYNFYLKCQGYYYKYTDITTGLNKEPSYSNNKNNQITNKEKKYKNIHTHANFANKNVFHLKPVTINKLKIHIFLAFYLSFITLYTYFLIWLYLIILYMF